MNSLLRILLLAALMLTGARATAHEMSMAEMELRQISPTEFQWRWTASGNRPASEVLKLVWPEDCRAETEVVRCGSAGLSGKLTIKGVGKAYSAAMVKVIWLDGQSRVYALTGSQPSVRLHASADENPSGAWSYLYLGIEHILLGVDHLLFVLGLLLIVRDRWMLVKTVTAFTVAHSITLAVATFGVAKVAAAPLNAAIALSILFLGPEIVRRWRGETSFTIRHPWVVAFAFGLLHGFGFASGLAQLGLSEAQIPLALLLFNVGVEIGQLAFVIGILLLERSFRLLEFHWPKLVERLPGYLVGTLGAYWTIQRVAILLRGVT
ncbi:MAG: HupE/UreJ family protein [Candidatus Competibacteraceae bacterium]|nr:HupE/UreJ family protein [Caldilineaceae bacterium]MCB1768215.1 HupE/UreJ family protein [Candidatus Competibacteraceae bacterium]